MARHLCACCAHLVLALYARLAYICCHRGADASGRRQTDDLLPPGCCDHCPPSPPGPGPPQGRPDHARDRAAAVPPALAPRRGGGGMTPERLSECLRALAW